MTPERPVPKTGVPEESNPPDDREDIADSSVETDRESFENFLKDQPDLNYQYQNFTPDNQKIITIFYSIRSSKVLTPLELKIQLDKTRKILEQVTDEDWAQMQNIIDFITQSFPTSKNN